MLSYAGWFYSLCSSLFIASYPRNWDVWRRWMGGNTELAHCFVSYFHSPIHDYVRLIWRQGNSMWAVLLFCLFVFLFPGWSRICTGLQSWICLREIHKKNANKWAFSQASKLSVQGRGMGNNWLLCLTFNVKVVVIIIIIIGWLKNSQLWGISNLLGLGQCI